jgi:transglutaminase-like putative cysteine protease
LEVETATATAKPPWRVVEIRNDSRRGSRYFTPLGASYVQGVSQGSLTVDPNGIIQSGLSTESRYRIYVGEGGKVGLTAPQAQMLTSTPPSSQSQFIRRRAQQIARDQTTAVDKINAIEDYCQSNYQWSAASPVIPIPKKNDPLTYFLLNEPPATCEYFASAAAVLLREVGVPSRYVTGFLVLDRGQAQDYWEARNRNAHAWVEAYDDLAQQWITVEPTPGMRRNKGRRGGGGNWQRQKQNEKQTGSKFKIARVERQTVYRRFQDFIGSLLGLPAILSLVGTIAIALLIDRRYRNAPPTEQKWLAQVERQLKRHKLVRRRSETLHQFAGRIKIYPYGYQQDPPLSDVADWLKRYALFRYSVLPYGLERPPKRS